MFGNLTTKPIDGGPRPQPNSKDREKYIKDLARACSIDLAALLIISLPLGINAYIDRKERVSVGRFRVPVPVLFGVGVLSVSAFFYHLSVTSEVHKAWTDKYGKESIFNLLKSSNDLKNIVFSASIRFEPFYRRALWPSIGYLFAPLKQMDRRELDRFFDGIQPQLRDHVAQLTMSDSGQLSYKVDVSGFRPEEIKVELKDNEIVVEGEHREQNQSESVHRQFCRRVLIPEGIQKESIKCELDAGRLCITGMKTTGDGKRSIPIVVKKAIEQKRE